MACNDVLKSERRNARGNPLNTYIRLERKRHVSIPYRTSCDVLRAYIATVENGSVLLCKTPCDDDVAFDFFFSLVVPRRRTGKVAGKGVLRGTTRRRVVFFVVSTLNLRAGRPTRLRAPGRVSRFARSTEREADRERERRSSQPLRRVPHSRYVSTRFSRSEKLYFFLVPVPRTVSSCPFSYDSRPLFLFIRFVFRACIPTLPYNAERTLSV